jgi:5-enolpyruvylshikimate-3-phosphate synthase
MASLAQIDGFTRDFSDKRKTLSTRVRALEDEIAAIRLRHMPGIRTAADDVAEAQALLRAAIAESQCLFKRPKTMILHGTTVGFKKAKGKVKFNNAATVIKLIKKHLSEKQDLLIKTTEKLLKSGIEKLSVGELKQIGCEVKETGDEIVIKPTDSDIDKLVDALLKEGAKELEEVA